MDQNGKQVTKIKYDNEPYSSVHFDGVDSTLLIMVELDGKYGFINENGKEVIKPIYENMYNFSGDYVRLMLNGKWGYLDRFGKKVTPFIYDAVSPFVNGYAEVVLNNEKMLIDLNGKKVKSLTD